MSEPTVTHDRRAADKANEAKLQADLDAMVLAENDPSKRANLMVLTAIYRGLVVNTAATHEVQDNVAKLTSNFNAHVDNFSDHAKTEEALLNKGRGAWFALAWFLGVVQIVGGYIIVDTRDTIRATQEYIHESRLADHKLMSRIEHLEQRK